LTGLTSQVVGVTDPSVQLAVESALNSGKAVVLGTSDTPKTLVPDHCYAALGANSGGLELYNPLGSSVLVDCGVIAQEGTCLMMRGRGRAVPQSRGPTVASLRGPSRSGAILRARRRDFSSALALTVGPSSEFSSIASQADQPLCWTLRRGPA